MSEQSGFAVSKLASYTTDEIAAYMATFEDRAEKLSNLQHAYNGKAGEALKGPGTPQEQLGRAKYWSGLRDVSGEMANDAQKKAVACQVELHLRQ